MKNKKKKLSLILFALLVLFFRQSAFSQEATVTAFKGKVEVLRKGEKAWVAVKEGLALSEGDKIRSFNQSTCVLKFKDDKIIKLSSFVTFMISGLKTADKTQENIKLKVWGGKIYTKVKKTLSADSSFEVQTPTAIAGVRGTEFSVDVSGEEKTEIASTDGIVTVQNQSYTPDVSIHKILLQPFQKTTVLKNKPPEIPQPLSEKEKKQEQDEQKDIEQAKVPEDAGEKLYLVLNVAEDEVETEEDDIEISGAVSDKEADLELNGEKIDVKEDGMFEKKVLLKDGENTLVVSAKNKKGESVKRTVKVKRKGKGQASGGVPQEVVKAIFHGVLKSALATGVITQEEYALFKLQAKIGTVTFSPQGTDDAFPAAFLTRKSAARALKKAQIAKKEGGFLLTTENGKKYEIKISVCK